MIIEFPILTSKPVVDGFQHSFIEDVIHRKSFESGAVVTRPLFTNIPVSWKVQYTGISNEDKETLELWEKNDIGFGGTQFVWLNPKTNKKYWSKLFQPIKYEVHGSSFGNLWNIALTLVTLGIHTGLYGEDIYGSGIYSE